MPNTLTAEDHHRIFEEVASVYGCLPRDGKSHSCALYAIGGSAMVLSGLKDTTKDVDLVMPNPACRESLATAVLRVGYSPRENPTICDPRRGKGHSVMFRRGDEYMDVFGTGVGAGYMTDDMRMRAQQSFKYCDLKVKVLSPTDIFILKSTTLRYKDDTDLENIARVCELDWTAMVREVGSWNDDQNGLSCLRMAADRLAKKGITVPASIDRLASATLRDYRHST